MRDDLLSIHKSTKDVPREVVRITTTYWSDNRTLHCKKSITIQRRKSQGAELLLHDASMIGPDLVFANIVNLNECKDGLYVAVTCNEHRDWESGYIEDYDYKLIPYDPTQIAS